MVETNLDSREEKFYKKANNKERNIQSTAELKELRSYIPFFENG